MHVVCKSSCTLIYPEARWPRRTSEASETVPQHRLMLARRRDNIPRCACFIKEIMAFASQGSRCFHQPSSIAFCQNVSRNGISTGTGIGTGIGM
jgi:hypothetical protein